MQNGLILPDGAGSGGKKGKGAGEKRDAVSGDYGFGNPVGGDIGESVAIRRSMKTIRKYAEGAESEKKRAEAWGDYFEMLRLLKGVEGLSEDVKKYNDDTRSASQKLVLASQDPDIVEQMYELNKKTYFFRARDDFHSFLIYVEWNRPAAARFYQPRMHYLKPIVQGYQDVLDGNLDLLTISMVKRGGKSQLEINFVNMLSGLHPDRSSLVEGAGDALVMSFYKGCLEYLTQNSEYLYYDVFPEAAMVQTNADLKTIDLSKKSRFPTIMCRSIEATQVGLSEATNVLCLDDCVRGREEAHNRELLDKKWETISGDVIGRAIEGTPIVATGTRYSLYDPIGRLLDHAENVGWKYREISLPALDDEEKSTCEYYNPKIGRKVFTTDWFLTQRDFLSDEQFQSEFQQRPYEANGVLFPESQLKRYFDLPAGIVPDAIIAVCDTAEGKGDSVMLPVAYIYGEDIFIEDCVFDNSTPEHTKPQCAELLVKHGVSRATFESNLAGTYYARDVDKLVKNMGGRCSITTRRTISNKETRIELASDNILKHFYFKDKSRYEAKSQYGRMMKELVRYVRVGKKTHDDAPDGLSLLENEIRRLVFGKATVTPRMW